MQLLLMMMYKIADVFYQQITSSLKSLTFVVKFRQTLNNVFVLAEVWDRKPFKISTAFLEFKTCLSYSLTHPAKKGVRIYFHFESPLQRSI